jgi:DUF4097 and DUF4098 domain-containing protein YvlB
MAGYPPPYPPPGSPFGYDARSQARFVRSQMKAQMRAQKAAFRIQRAMYRQQARALRRSSILGPLLVVSIGVLLLLIRLGRLPYYRFEGWYGRWWPIVFVAAGLVLMLEWVFDQHSTQDGVPFVRRGIGGGSVFLLILIALTGMSIEGLHDGVGVLAHGVHVDSEDLGQFFGERHDFEQEIDQPFPRGTTLNLYNPHGDVTIVGKSDDDKIHIVVNKQVYSMGDHEASSRADELSPHLELTGGTLTVSVPTVEDAQADLALTIPDFGQTTISADHGDVTLSDLRAPVNITANHGDVELDRIAGSVTAHVNNNGSSFSAHGIQGDLTLRGHADEVNLTEVGGAVSIEGEIFGDSHFEHLAGPFSFRTNRTQFSIAKLDGMVDISNDAEMTGSQLVGPVELHTRSRNISFERVAGSVNISNSNGTVDLTDASPLGNVSVENQDGEVTVTVPDHAGFTIDAQARDGGIEDDVLHASIESDPLATHTGTVGDGAAHLSLHTTHADINIHQGIVEPPVPPQAANAPAAPAPPPPPSAPKHRLTVKKADATI